MARCKQLQSSDCEEPDDEVDSGEEDTELPLINYLYRERHAAKGENTSLLEFKKMVHDPEVYVKGLRQDRKVIAFTDMMAHACLEAQCAKSGEPSVRICA